MSRRRFGLLAMVVLCFCAIGEEIAWKDGPLPNVRKHIAALVKLRVMNGRLAIDQQHWNSESDDKKEQNEEIGGVGAGVKVGARIGVGGFVMEEDGFGGPVKERLNKLINDIGAYNSGSSSGSEVWNISFSGNSMNGKMALDNKGAFHLLLEERGSEARKLDVSDNGKSLLSLQLISPPDDGALILFAKADGSISIAWFSGDEPKAFAAKSFAALLAKAPDFAREKLFPLLKHYGIGLPMSELEIPVICAALEMAIGAGQLGKKKVEDIVNRLDSDEFKVRKSARDDLDRAYLRFSNTLKEAVNQSKSAELKLAISNAQKKYDVDLNEARALAQGLGLASSIAYFAELLRHEREDIRADAREALVKLTGKDLGDDPVAYKKLTEEKK